jgi:hypothetical protein
MMNELPAVALTTAPMKVAEGVVTRVDIIKTHKPTTTTEIGSMELRRRIASWVLQYFGS